MEKRDKTLIEKRVFSLARCYLLILEFESFLLVKCHFERVTLSAVEVHSRSVTSSAGRGLKPRAVYRESVGLEEELNNTCT